MHIFIYALFRFIFGIWLCKGNCITGPLYVGFLHASSKGKWFQGSSLEDQEHWTTSLHLSLQSPLLSLNNPKHSIRIPNIYLYVSWKIPKQSALIILIHIFWNNLLTVIIWRVQERVKSIHYFDSDYQILPFIMNMTANGCKPFETSLSFVS